jgi:PAS domain S-box-containing protein
MLIAALESTRGHSLTMPVAGECQATCFVAVLLESGILLVNTDGADQLDYEKNDDLPEPLRLVGCALFFAAFASLLTRRVFSRRIPNESPSQFQPPTSKPDGQVVQALKAAPLAGSRFRYSRVRELPSTDNGNGFVPDRIDHFAEPVPSRALLSWRSVLLPAAIAVWGASSFRFQLGRRPAFEEPTLDGTWVEGGVLKRSALNEARMMAIIRSSKEAIITIDENQQILMFNPMAEQVFGIPAAQAVGTSLERLMPERFRQVHATHVHQFGITGVSDRQMGRQRVLFGLRANGDEFPIEASISQIRDADGKLYTVVLRDVTERVKADTTLKASREELRALSANLQHVREEEKQRIARELHDDLGQQLTALKMELSSVENMLYDGLSIDSAVRVQLAAQIQGMRRLIDATVTSVRRIAADLRPVMLDDLGLVPAIEWLVNDFTSRYGIPVETNVEHGETKFSPDAATTLFRIVQEALTNVAKHAQATLVTLAISVEGGECILRVSDNGHGEPDRAAPEGKSFGLLGMRERAHMLGGEVSIDSSTGHGFSVTVRFPLNAVQLDEMSS